MPFSLLWLCEFYYLYLHCALEISTNDTQYTWGEEPSFKRAKSVVFFFISVRAESKVQGRISLTMTENWHFFLYYN